jgi:hypothetical protein
MIMGLPVLELIQLLQEVVREHGDDTEVAVAVPLGWQPFRQEIMGFALDREVRQPDEPDPDPDGPPLVWLLTGTPGPGSDIDPYAPRRACTPRVSDEELKALGLDPSGPPPDA